MEGRYFTMILPESAPMQEKDYPYLNHANAMWKRLGMIKNGAIEYCSDDYAALANTLERFYKGFLQIQMDLNPDYKLPKGYLTNDHDLVKLVKKISVFVPLYKSSTPEECQIRNKFLMEFRRAYSQARYTVEIPYTQFCQVYDLVAEQKKILDDYLAARERQLEEMALDM